MFLDVLLGIGIGAVFLRAGLPSLFPLLLWLPVVNAHISGWVILGLASASISSLSTSTASPHEDVLIGYFTAFVALVLFSFFIQPSFFDAWIAPVLLVALSAWFISSARKHIPTAASGLLLLGVGWWLVHERVIPLLLPAFFSGWYGLSWFRESVYASFSHAEKWRDACIGCLAGLLPGIGPGLVNVLWFSRQTSPALGVSNLVFSIGLLAQAGSVRSVFAAELGSLSSLPWWLIVLFLGIGFATVWSLRAHFFSASIFPYSIWMFFNGAGILLGGGFLSLLVFGLSYFLRRSVGLWNVSLDAGVFILIPSIVIFYASF